MWEPRRLTTLWAFTACYKDSFIILPFTYIGILYHSFWRTSSSCFRDVGGGNLFLNLVSELTRVVQWCPNLVIIWAREDAEVRLHVLQNMTEQFQLCECGHCRLGKFHRCSEITSGSWDSPDTQPVHVFQCSNSSLKGNNRANRIQSHDLAAQTITEPPPYFTVGTRHCGL
jgi:hypothetical protein